MRVLQLHCSSFSYKIREETPVAERPLRLREEVLEDVLVCFTCFEKKDEGKSQELVEAYSENLFTDVKRIGCKRVLIYPYAHLSQRLGSPREARSLLKKLGERLSDLGVETHLSAFGWYKSFELSCIGHPLAEAYREY
jgi:threonyl-tRNA synthetase